MESTTQAPHWDLGMSLLMVVCLGLGIHRPEYFLFLPGVPKQESLERSRLACWIHSGLEKNWSQAMRKKDQLSCCLGLWKELCFIFKAPRVHLRTAFTLLLLSFNTTDMYPIQTTEPCNRPCSGTDWQPKLI